MKGTPDLIRPSLITTITLSRQQIVLPKAEIVLHELLVRLYVNEDYPKVRALLKRNGMNEVNQLLLDALTSCFKKLWTHSRDRDPAFDVLS